VSATRLALNFNPVFSKISLSELVFNEVVALFGTALCLLFLQKLARTQARRQALPLPLAVSCPSVRDTFGVEFQPLFFQRPASRGWSLIGLRHFSTLRCACFLHKSCHSRRHCPCPLRTMLFELI
jgi:hypothetical protein